MHSYASAENFDKNGEKDENIKNYIKRHPLNTLLSQTSWNNIPRCLVELSQLLIDAIIGQEIH